MEFTQQELPVSYDCLNNFRARKIETRNSIPIDHPPRKYVGCFDDDEKKIKGKYLSYQMGANNSPKRCMNLCNTQRFHYAAVTEY